MNKNKIRKELLNGSLEKVFNILDDFFKDSNREMHDYINVLSSKYSQLSKSKKMRFVSLESYQRAISQIQMAILEDVIPQIEIINNIRKNKEKSKKLKILEQKKREIEEIKSALDIYDENNKLITEKTLREYLKKRFSLLPFGSYENHFEVVFPFIDTKKYKYTRDLDFVFSLTAKAREEYKESEVGKNSQLIQLALALGCLDPGYRASCAWSTNAKNIFDAFNANNDYCSFCGSHKSEKRLLIGGINATICETCVDEAVKMKEDELN